MNAQTWNRFNGFQQFLQGGRFGDAAILLIGERITRRRLGQRKPPPVRARAKNQDAFGALTGRRPAGPHMVGRKAAPDAVDLVDFVRSKTRHVRG